MPMIAKGVYADCGDRAYETETTYYLNYHIISALVSLSHLDKYEDDYEWENKCQYYHYYCDHLLYSIGQISNRFVKTINDKPSIIERKETNCKNYSFSSTDYNVLSNKQARNVIEHIDEYDQKIIAEKRGVGGFNLIDVDTEKELIEELRTRTDTHPYILDKQKKEILIRRNDEDMVISLEDLRRELLQLKGSVKSFMHMISVN